MDKNHEITLEQEIAKELGWEVMANFRRLGDNLEENLVLKKIYKKILYSNYFKYTFSVGFFCCFSNSSNINKETF